METIIAVLFAGVLCLILGAGMGRKGARKPPEPKPVARKEAELTQRRLEIIMKNIENYDGTAFGQEDVPGR